MVNVTNIRKSLTDTTPLYAAVGVADLAVSRLRSAGDEAAERAQSLRTQLEPGHVIAQAQAFPEQVVELGDQARAQAEATYDDLSRRGAQAVARVKDSSHGQQLVEQGRSAVADARRFADDAQARTAGAVFAGRKQVAKGVEVAAESVADASEELEAQAGTRVRSNAAREGAAKPAAKKPATRKPAARTSTAKKTTAKKKPSRAAVKKASQKPADNA